MAAFEFATAQRIKFGPGAIRQLAGLTSGFGRRALLITGGGSLERSGRLREIEEQLTEAEIAWRHLHVMGEPTVELIDMLMVEAAGFDAEVVIGIGGGSVLDCAKALAALLANGGNALDYLEGVGNGGTLSKPSLPCIAAPTTAGTGSEATRNAVIGDAAHTFKRSMRSATMLPALALVDPELTYNCPPAITAACGMDALTQLIEAYTSLRASPLTDSLALQGLGNVAELPFLVADAEDYEAREAMALAGLLSGICLANAGLGAVHGLASPLGAFFPIPHGIACAALLAPVVRMNIVRALEQDEPGVIFKYASIYEILAGASNLNGELDDDDDDENEDDLLIDTNPTRKLLNDQGEVMASEADWPRADDDPDETSVLSGDPADDDEDEDEVDEGPSEDQIDLALAADSAMQLAQYVLDLKSNLKLPGLGQFGITASDFDRIISGASGSSMQTNPVKLTADDLAQVLDAAL